MAKSSVGIGMGVAVGLLFVVWTTVTCGGKDDKNPQDRTTGHRIGLREIFPYDAKGNTLQTFIVDRSDASEIKYFALLNIEAKDQTGKPCPFDGTSVGIIKGGIQVIISSKIDLNVAEKVIVKAKMIINDNVVDVVCGYRKRTSAERTALNPDVEWTYLDEPKEVKVSKIEGR